MFSSQAKNEPRIEHEANPILEGAVSVSILDVWITRDAQITVGLAAKQLAVHYGLNLAEIRKALGGKVYYNPESNELCLIIEPKDEVVESMYVVIPEGQWGFRGENAPTH